MPVTMYVPALAIGSKLDFFVVVLFFLLRYLCFCLFAVVVLHRILYIMTERERGRETDRQRDIERERLIDRQPDRQTDRQTDRNPQFAWHSLPVLAITDLKRTFTHF